MRAAHEGAPCGAGQNDVVDVSTSSLNEANVLAAPQRLADVAALPVRLLRRHRAHPPVSRRWAWRRDAAGFELAAEIVPAMVPMYRGHHLAVAPGARGAVGDERAETCRLPGQLRLA